MDKKNIKILNWSFYSILAIILFFMALIIWAVINSSSKKEASPFYQCTTKTVDCLFECIKKHENSMVLKLSCGSVCSVGMGKCNISVFSNSFSSWVSGEQKTPFPQDVEVEEKRDDIPSLEDKEALKKVFEDVPDDLKKMTYEEFIKQEEK